MNRWLRFLKGFLVFALCVTVAVYWSGCGSSTNPPEAGHSHGPGEHDHDHDGEEAHDHDHDHEGEAEHDHDHEEGEGGHGHAHSAPHGGTLIALGEHFAHLELVVDATAGKATVYALDGEAEKPLRLPQEKIGLSITRKVGDAVSSATLELLAVTNPLTGEQVGDSSEFSGESELLKGADRFEGVVQSVSIQGETLEGVRFAYPEGNE